MPRQQGQENLDPKQWIESELDALTEAVAILLRTRKLPSAVTERIKRIREALGEL